MQKGASCRQVFFCPTFVQAGYNACPASLSGRKRLKLWKKSTLSTVQIAFTITTIFVYTSVNLYMENPDRDSGSSRQTTIKPCTSPDDPDWLTLRHTLWPELDLAGHHEELKDLCSQPQRFGQFLAFSDQNEAQGFVEIAIRTDYVNGTNTSPVAFLEGIFVLPQFRTQGIARALIKQAEAWALEKGCTELASDTPLDNTASQSMHKALGFQETERVVYFCKEIRPKN